jgi:hypothetical protein
MFDFSWGDGGVTIYWPTNQNPVYPGTGYPGPVYTGGGYPVNQTQISTGTLIALAVLAYLLLKK